MAKENKAKAKPKPKKRTEPKVTYFRRDALTLCPKCYVKRHRHCRGDTLCDCTRRLESGIVVHYMRCKRCDHRFKAFDPPDVQREILERVREERHLELKTEIDTTRIRQDQARDAASSAFLAYRITRDAATAARKNLDAFEATELEQELVIDEPDEEPVTDE